MTHHRMDTSPRQAAGDPAMDQDRFDRITLAVAEGGAGPTLTRRLFSGGAAALLVALGIRAAGIEEAEAGPCRQKCRDKNTRQKRRRCRRRCDNRPQVGCSPANNTQGSCPAGQICNTNAICVAGCSPANNTQGSCPQGQICNPSAICVAGCTGTPGRQGSCPPGQLCNASGQCQSEPLGCAPPNNTRGSCPAGQICNTNSICVAS